MRGRGGGRQTIKVNKIIQSKNVWCDVHMAASLLLGDPLQITFLKRNAYNNFFFFSGSFSDALYVCLSTPINEFWPFSVLQAESKSNFCSEPKHHI
jgi:hypothetical protein